MKKEQRIWDYTNLMKAEDGQKKFQVFLFE